MLYKEKTELAPQCRGEELEKPPGKAPERWKMEDRK